MTKTHAEYQAIGRARRQAAGLCRQCPEPAALRPDGTTMSACRKHLDADAKRSKDRKLVKRTEEGTVSDE